MDTLKIIMTTVSMVVFYLGYGQGIKGTVMSDSNIPIDQAKIMLNGNVISYTNDLGQFNLTDASLRLPLKISVTKEGFYVKEDVLNKNNQIIILTSLLASEILDPVVLSATYKKKSGVLIPTTTISQQTIEQFNPTSLINVVNQTSGVYIQSGAINTNRITIRGVGSRTLFGTNKIRAYFNGIPITNGAGETAIDSYNANSTATIEIIKGPKATQYGTNLGGTLLLSSKEAVNDGATFNSEYTVGSFGLLKNTLGLSIQENDLNIQYSYDHLHVDGYRENNTYNRNGHLLSIEKSIGKNFSVDVIVQHINSFAQIASSLSREDFDENPVQAAFTWGQAKGFEKNRSLLLGSSITSAISETLSNTTSIYYSYLDHYEPRPFNILDEETNGYGARSIFAKSYTVNDRKAKYSTGAEWNQDFYKWDTIENLYESNNGDGSLEGAQISANEEIRSSLNAFATTTIPLTNSLQAEIGMNVNVTNYKYFDTFNPNDNSNDGNRNFDPIIAPNLNLLYRVGSQLQFFGNISRGFNYPSIEETLTPEGAVNPEIGPEKGWNYEIGVTLGFFNNALKITPQIYLISITDLLVAERIGNDQFIGRNAGKTEHKGIETEITYSEDITQKLSLQSYANIEYNAHQFIDFIDGDEDFSGNDLTGVPKNKISVGLSLQHDTGIFMSTNYQYIGTQPLTDENSLYSDAFELLNIQMGIRKRLFNNLDFELLAGVDNVANIKYASSILINASSFGGNAPRYYYPGNPRNVYSSLRLSYNL
ncbi:TonB-dependent receptor [Psychroserpens sp.]|uniref:TonB-dependent receptor n=1 Tax=Psychroserpens sp. TaxID=2020870 RepID=UPI003C7819D4